MKSIVSSILFVSIFLFLSVSHSNAQVTVSGSTSEDATYATLSLAFSAINGTVQTGNDIVIEVSSNTIETTSATLNEGAWNSLTVYPTLTGLSISGNISSPLINLNGADNVTLDGRVNQIGAADLTIVNSDVGTSSSTFQFVNSAEKNKIQYCNIKGSETSTTRGVIFFSTATEGNGNDANIIDNNNISSNLNARPINAIYSRGTTGFENSENIISNNNIFDFLRHGLNSNGVYLYSNTTAWTISGNSFYETTLFTPTANTTNNIIYIYNYSGNNFDISDNFIGGSSSYCEGTAWTKTSDFDNVFNGILLYVGTTTASNIQNNTISNLSWNNATSATWKGIYIDAGAVNIGTTTGNTIGEATGTGSIYITQNTTGGDVYGIYIDGSGLVECENNIISSIITDNTSVNASNFYGIYKVNNGNATFVNNTIGSTSTLNSIFAKSTSTENAQSVYGIYNAGSGNISIRENFIVNLTNATTNTTPETLGVINGIASTSGTNFILNNIISDLTIANSNTSNTHTASVSGIALSGGGTKTVTGNTIYNLSNTYSSYAGSIIGLFYTGSTGTNVVSSNFIYNLAVSDVSTTATIYAIKINTGRTTYSNNIINLGGSTTTTLYGIYDLGTSGNNNNFYFNTVCIGGNPPESTSNKSYAFYSDAGVSTRNIRNNIFLNARSTVSGVSLHYAAYFNYAVNTNLTLDYNDYYAPGVAGVIGYYNSANVTSLPLISTKDANSLIVDPEFTNAGGTSDTDYKPKDTSLGGIAIPGITTDFSGTIRASTPTMGAVVGALNLNVLVYTSGVFQATYLRLKDAFDKINNGTHKGVIDIIINDNTLETASAVLNASGIGSANYSSIHIFPNKSGLTISGNLAAPLINLNGADAVTIDGSVDATGTTKDLIISNINTGTSSSTIQFFNSAENNVVKYCVIKGAETSSTRGVLFFATSTTGNGNDNNTIENNDFTGVSAAVSGRPRNVIFSRGASGFENSGNVIRNNNIYNFLKQGSTSNGINISTFSTAWTITGNSFYETTPLVPIASTTFNAITISNTLGANFTVTDNFIGGSAEACAGSPWTKTNTFNNTFNAIYLNIGTAIPSNVHNNTIKNFEWSNSSNATWAGINVAAGDVNIGTVTGNTIGAPIGNGSIIIGNSTAGGNVFGMYLSSIGTLNCKNNSIGSINVGNVNAAYSTNFYGIYKSGNAGALTIESNIIGSTSTSNSINAVSTSTSSSQSIYGIYSGGNGLIAIANNTIANLNNSTTNINLGTRGLVNGIASVNGTNIITNNTIRNLSNANANNAGGNTASVTGIALSGTTLRTVNNNTIYNLSNSYPSFAGYVIGIFFSGNTGANEVSRNFIHSLNVTGGSVTTPSLFGIRISAGATTYSNNIISIGGNTPSTIYGIYENGGALNNNNFYFNTVNINGFPTTGNLNSYAFNNATNTNVRNFKNNLFVNARSNNGATGKHYAIYLSGIANLTIDYNDYFVSGNGSVLGYYSGDRMYLNDWKMMTLQDQNSISLSPGFANPIGTTATNYKPSATSLYGVAGSGIVTDYEGTTRNNPPAMGAFKGTLTTPVVAVYQSNIKIGNYNSLQTAFNAINSGTHTGALEMRINANLFELSNVLNASGVGSASYSSINIYPTRSGLSIYGNVAAPLIDLNGADNVTIDGRVNATGNLKNLIIINANTSNTAATSTIRFINDASNNTIKYTTIKGSETNTASGVIFFSTALAGGNDGNLIDNNNITNSIDATRPINGIFSLGSVSNDNSGNIISNNNLYDIFSKSSSSNAIQFGANNTASTITGNSIYETASFAPTSSVTYNGILISNAGNEFNISGNYIGGQAANCSGNAFTKSIAVNSAFTGINLSVGAGVASQIQNNFIRNISWSNSSNSAWTGINVTAGDVNIGTINGNTIGASTGIGNITYTNSTSGGAFYGINISSAGTVDCQKNTIGSILVANVNPAYATNFYGINKSSTAGSTTISNNIIGSTSTAKSIHTSSASTSNTQYFFGIYTAGSGIININNNTLSNLSNGTTNATTTVYGVVNGITSVSGTNNITNNIIRDLSIANANIANANTASVCGISLTGNTLKTVSENVIYNLSNSYSSFAGSIIGIYFTGNTGANIVSRNFIHSLSSTSVLATASTLYGIKIAAGATTYSNNIISLGVNTPSTIYGIYEYGTSNNNNNLYFNTVYIGGNLNAGNVNKSYALYSASNSNIRNLRNNIFMNNRSTTGGSNLHYAAFFYYYTNTNLTLNYNTYYAPNTGGVLGYYFGLNVNLLPLVITKDVNSNVTNPGFVNEGGTSMIDYKIAENLIGETGTGISADYGYRTRTAPTIGAWEKFVNKWKGSINTTWSLTANWSESYIPKTTDDIIFDDAPSNSCQLDQNASIKNITNTQGAYNMFVNGYKLAIKGTLNLTNGAYVDATTPNSIIEYGGNSTQTIQSEYFKDSEIDNLIIDNSIGVTLNKDLKVNNSLTINAGKLLTIPPATLLNVVGNVTNNAGVSGLVIQSSPTSANGSLIFHNPKSSPVPATVEMYSKASCLSPETKTNYQWQFIGIPVRSIQAGATYYESWLRKCDETILAPASRWVPQTNSSILTSFSGYEITQDVAKTFSIRGNLENKDTTFVMTYTAASTYPGQNVYSNPYLAAIDITKLTFGSDAEATVYLYNTGSFADWTNTGYGTSYGNNPGQYLSVPKGNAGQPGLPLEIPSMQGFLVKVKKSTANSTLSINYNSVVVKNTDKQRAPTNNDVLSTEKVSTIIDVKGTNTSDRMWIFSQPNSTRSFDNGWDGRKIIGSTLTPQLFAVEADGIYQVNTVPDMNETKLGFQPGEDEDYTFVFTHHNIERLYSAIYLIDFHENKITDVTASGTQYSFSAKPAQGNGNRFKIVTSHKNTDGNELENEIKIFSANGTIFVQNFSSNEGQLKLFNVSGNYLKEIPFYSNTITSFSGKLFPGVYIVCAVMNNESVNKCIIVK